MIGSFALAIPPHIFLPAPPAFLFVKCMTIVSISRHGQNSQDEEEAGR
jgi:hypothetical protein